MARRKSPRSNTRRSTAPPASTTTEPSKASGNGGPSDDAPAADTTTTTTKHDPPPQPNGSNTKRPAAAPADSKAESDPGARADTESAPSSTDGASATESDADTESAAEAGTSPTNASASADSDPVPESDADPEAGKPAKADGDTSAEAGSDPEAVADLDEDARGVTRAGGPEPEPEPQADSEADNVRVAPVARPPGASRQRAIRAALRTLPVPEPGPSFWADLDAALAEQGRLAVTARPAIRPISEPPPLSQPRLGDRLATSAADDLASQGRRAEHDFMGRPRTPGKRGVAVAVVAVLVGLFVVGTVLDDDSEETPPRSSSTSTSLAEGEVASTVPGSTTTTVPQIPGLDPAAPLTSTGIGPLQVGMTRRQLQERGVDTTVDEASFQTGEGRCFSGAVPVPAAADVVLWFRSLDPEQGVSDPLDGVLAAVSVNALEGSTRPSETGLRLGAPVDQVAGAHQGQLDTMPGQAGEQVYVREAPDGSDIGIAYVTDGAVVTKINVGFLDVIPQPETCTA